MRLLPLIELTRGGILECQHVDAMALVNARGLQVGERKAVFRLQAAAGTPIKPPPKVRS